jgi:uncharacterized protein YndB with AHSA1/START domain
MITDTGVLEHEVTVQAPPETVFDYFVDADKLVRWMGTRATLEPRPGGLFHLEYREGTVRGEFVEVERPSRIVFTWGWEDPADAVQPGGSTVEVTLAAEGTATLVRLRHLGLPEESRAGHAQGWEQFLPRLVEAARAVPA